MKDLTRYYKEKEIAQIFDIAPQTLRIHRCHKKGLPFVKIAGAVRYELDAVKAYLEANTIINRKP